MEQESGDAEAAEAAAAAAAEAAAAEAAAEAERRPVHARLCFTPARACGTEAAVSLRQARAARQWRRALVSLRAVAEYERRGRDYYRSHGAFLQRTGGGGGTEDDERRGRVVVVIIVVGVFRGGRRRRFRSLRSACGRQRAVQHAGESAHEASACDCRPLLRRTPRVRDVAIEQLRANAWRSRRRKRTRWRPRKLPKQSAFGSAPLLARARTRPASRGQAQRHAVPWRRSSSSGVKAGARNTLHWDQRASGNALFVVVEK